MRYLLAVCLLCSIPSSHAGTVTGVAEGTADIAIQQIVKGQPEGLVYHDGLPATLTYTINADNSFQFSLTDSVYSFDTASSLISGPRSYFTYFAPPPYSNEFWFLDTGIYHIYSLSAEIGLAIPSDTMASVGFDLIVADDTGTGYEVQGSFVDPPASVPEPSSVVMMACAALTILLSLTLAKKA